jgi:nucleoside-diphosphate-sugar epimerase
MSSKRVLLTGANGYLAQHILSQFLSAGHSVRGIVRSQSKVEQLQKSFSGYSSSQLDFGVVPDISRPGAFDEALKSDPPFDWVIHTASPFNYRKATGASNAENFLDPAIKGTTEVLEAIKRVAPSVKRVVLTGSMASVITWSNPKVTHPAKVYTGADWNPVTLEDAVESTQPNTAYQASKKFAEKAAWDFVANEKPNFDLVTLNPPMIYGPLFDPAQFASPSDLNQSTWGIYSNFLRAGLKSSDPLPPTGLHLYVDVRDVARAHLLSASVPEAGGKRFVVCGGNMNSQRIANLLREKLPEKRDVVPVGNPDEWDVEEGTYEGGSEEAKRVLGLEFRSAESTIGDLAEQFVDIETRGAQ